MICNYWKSVLITCIDLPVFLVFCILRDGYKFHRSYQNYKKMHFSALPSIAVNLLNGIF